LDRISGIIITFNESRNIADCIQSLENVVDEIIVVDSFSTDDTTAIAQSMGAIVHQNKFEGHIEQKNWAASKAKFDYILSLDADERLSPELIQSINELKKPFAHVAYEFNRLNNYCGTWIRHGGWYPDKKIRLWKKSEGKWSGENPHDRVDIDNNIQTKWLKGDILHYSFRNEEEHRKQIEYFTNIAAKALHLKNKKVSPLWPYLSGLFKFIKDYFFRLGLLDGKAGWKIAKNSAYASYLKYRKLRKQV